MRDGYARQADYDAAAARIAGDARKRESDYDLYRYGPTSLHRHMVAHVDEFEAERKRELLKALRDPTEGPKLMAAALDQTYDDLADNMKRFGAAAGEYRFPLMAVTEVGEVSELEATFAKLRELLS